MIEMKRKAGGGKYRRNMSWSKKEESQLRQDMSLLTGQAFTSVNSMLESVVTFGAEFPD